MNEMLLLRFKSRKKVDFCIENMVSLFQSICEEAGPAGSCVVGGDSSVVAKEVVVNNQVGLHARPATFFIQKANEFKSGIWVEKDERRVNAKSLLGVLSLGIIKGTKITIIADGSDEQQAVDTLCALIESNFSE